MFFQCKIIISDSYTYFSWQIKSFGFPKMVAILINPFNILLKSIYISTLYIYFVYISKNWKKLSYLFTHIFTYFFLSRTFSKWKSCISTTSFILNCWSLSSSNWLLSTCSRRNIIRYIWVFHSYCVYLEYSSVILSFSLKID